MGVLCDADRQQFRERGFVYVHDAFAVDDATAMRDVVWGALERTGIRRDDPATWMDETPAHLQDLKRAPEFQAVGSERTRAAIDDLAGAERWPVPRDWGAFFLLFPTARPWAVPHAAWHLDHSYTAPLEPVTGLKVHAMFGDVAPRAGGMTILAGSHRLVARQMAGTPTPASARAAPVRKALMHSHPYLRALGTDGDREARIARFHETDENVDGVPVRVVELTATAGDVILIHPLVLHTRPTNAGIQPRFLLNKDLYFPD